MSGGTDESFVAAVRPLVDAMGGRLLPPDEAGPDDVVLAWEGVDAVAVRLPRLAESLDHLLAALERRHGVPLADLDRRAKQEIVRSLEARGAFAVRHGVETVAGALGVSRFTVYNYLNREKEKTPEGHLRAV
ncbi:helix-turn-helix domain-containing protein [Streptomyces prasinus]|uniref:helix-turn-helix domain-containing protein n=1 Tax=Streptomyces prasinus TaxID=67345 RepID=UPI0033317F99